MQQGQVGALPLQDEVVQILVAQLLSGPALARRLPTPLQLGLHVGLEVARLKAEVQGLVVEVMGNSNI